MTIQRLIYILFLSIFLLEFLDRYDLIPHALTLLPEIISLTFVAIIVFFAAKQKVIYIGGLYWLIFTLLAVHIFFGTIVNEMQTTVVFNGLRNYFKYVPLFFLPAVYSFSDDDIKKQLRLLLWLALLQLPVSLYQQIIEGSGKEHIKASGSFSGDVVKGTLSTGGHQSVFLICVITILLAFYLRKRISRSFFLIISLLVFLPATINETKASLFLLPVALIVPVLLSGSLREKFRNLMLVSMTGAIFLGLFVGAYAELYSKDDRRFDNVFQALDFFGGENRFGEYLAPRATGHNEERVGKVDKLIIPLQQLSEDPIKFMFGLGMGNTSPSIFGDKFTGDYYQENREFRGGTIPNLLWEFGFLGVFFTTVIFVMIFKDTLQLKGRDDLVGALALGWAGVMTLIAISSIYRNFIATNFSGYLLMYFSGYIVATRTRKRLQKIELSQGNSSSSYPV